jgi:hypothetical protein
MYFKSDQSLSLNLMGVSRQEAFKATEEDRKVNSVYGQ